MPPATVFRRLVPAAAIAAALFVCACASPRYVIATPRQVDRGGWPAPRVTSHVVLVSIDGLRPDALDESAPVLQRLMREGSYTLAATTILPSKTLPSHTSMLTGEAPDRHGVLWNTVVTADRDLVEPPTIFGVARRRGYVTAAFYSKPKFQALQAPDALDYSQAPGGWFGGWLGEKTMTDVEHYLADARPNLLFVHVADPDRAGHRSGWMGADYRRAVRDSDAAVGRLIAAADRAFGDGRYTLIVTADHGGHRRDHGSDDPRDVTIPWIAWGQGVQAGRIDGPVRTMDTASTTLWLLGLEEPSAWSGAPVLTAFRPGAASSGDRRER